MKIIKLNKTGLTKIHKFCEVVHKKRSTRDTKRNDVSPNRLNNEIIGKIGECAAWKATKIGKLDFSYRETNTFKYDGDLDENTHVKTCHIKYKDSQFDSWTVDKKDPVCVSPKDNDIIILVYANEEGYSEIIGFVNAKEIQPYWKPTKLIPHKLAIYKNDIIHMVKNI